MEVIQFDSKDAESVLGYDIGLMGQGLPNPDGLEFQAMVFAPQFGVMGFFPISQILNPLYSDWGFNGKSARDGSLIVNEVNGGTVEFPAGKVVLKTNTAAGGEVSICIPGWADGGEKSLFNQMEEVIIAWSHVNLSSDGGAAGDTEWCAGQFEQESGILNATPADVNAIKGWWIYGKSVAGVVTEYLVTSTGGGSDENVSVTEITSGGGPNFASDRVLYVKITQGESGPTAITAYRGIGQNESLASHTEDLPSGECSTTNNARFTATIKNGAGDTNAREIAFWDNKLLYK